jgi:biotin operon repressor
MDANQDLFAVTTSRVHDGQKIRSTTMLTLRESVNRYVKECQRKGFEVLSIKHWRFVEEVPGVK